MVNYVKSLETCKPLKLSNVRKFGRELLSSNGIKSGYQKWQTNWQKVVYVIDVFVLSQKSEQKVCDGVQKS